MAKNNKNIECLRRLINEAEAFLKEGKPLLKKLENGEEVEIPSPISPHQKRQQFFDEVLSSNRRVKKNEILGL
ncbi:MAG: hypothetical protein CMC76_12230 [Flavobacteriaceae bacterium]|nr:hypothetical protein [Flavobacteriaceae bacterium]|tara:strand:+ start:3858 stop:4076 length:219 start_codon:yes stop_codon:yes gene_type:complete